jgi:hypothetical protein
MVHPPRRPDGIMIWTWLHRVQVAAAFICAHLDDGWQGSLRKRVLFSLAHGPLDWTVEAALVALAQIAREEPATVPDIGALYLELFHALPDRGGIPYLNALMMAATTLPSPPPVLREQLEQAVRALAE